MTTPDIFLSYNREDAATAKRFADGFAAEGLSVWWDTALRSGEAYDEVTEAALRGAKAVVVLWSPRSVVSRWVRAEATIADRNKTLVPVMIEPCERPIMFELTQTAELGHWQGEAKDKAWLAFVGDIWRFIGREVVSPASITDVAATTASTESKSFIPALAVLPIATRLGDADEDAAFAEDLTDELLTALSATSPLRILPGAMSSAWHSKLADVRPLARDLDARYILEGTLRRAGSEFRVACKLVEGSSGKVLWSQKFNRPLCELDDIPDALASEIAVQVADRSLWLEYELSASRTHDLTAWDHLNRSISAVIKTTSVSTKAAIDDARQALILAPGYGLAHATLAVALAVSTTFLGDEDGAKAAEARQHINAALDADKNSASVLLLVGGANNWLGEPETGLRILDRARALDPNVGAVHFHLEITNVLLGRTSEALAECDRYIEIATSEAMHGWAFMYRSIAYYLEGGLDQAAAAAERSQHFFPSGDNTLIWGVALAAIRGAEKQAKSDLAKLRVLEPTFTHDTGLTALALFLMADKAKMAEAQAAFLRVWTESAP